MTEYKEVTWAKGDVINVDKMTTMVQNDQHLYETLRAGSRGILYLNLRYTDVASSGLEDWTEMGGGIEYPYRDIEFSVEANRAIEVIFSFARYTITQATGSIHLALKVDDVIRGSWSSESQSWSTGAPYLDGGSFRTVVNNLPAGIRRVSIVESSVFDGYGIGLGTVLFDADDFYPIQLSIKDLGQARSG